LFACVKLVLVIAKLLWMFACMKLFQSLFSSAC